VSKDPEGAYAFPEGIYDRSATRKLSDAEDPAMARLELTIRTSAANVVENIRRRRRVRTATGGQRTPNTRIPLQATVRADISRLMGLLEAWALITGHDGAKVDGPLLRLSAERLIRIAKRHLDLDISEISNF